MAEESQKTPPPASRSPRYRGRRRNRPASSRPDLAFGAGLSTPADPPDEAPNVTDDAPTPDVEGFRAEQADHDAGPSATAQAPSTTADHAEIEESSTVESVAPAEPSEPSEPSPEQPSEQTQRKTHDLQAETHALAVELTRIEKTVRERLEGVDPRRRRKLEGTRRWHELQEDMMALQHTSNMDEKVIREVLALCAKRHQLFQRLNFLVATRPTWNT